MSQRSFRSFKSADKQLRKECHRNDCTWNMNGMPENDSLRTKRLELGMCPLCGIQTYQIRDGWTLSGRHRTMIPVTIPDLILEGRCLSCYPLRRAGSENSLQMQLNSGSSLDSADQAAGHHLIKKSNDPQLITLRDAKGRVFVGQVLEGTAEKGSGVFSHVYRNGGFKGKALVYEGEFSEGYFQGQGTYRGAGGDVYQGGFDKSSFSGEGKLNFSEGGSYEGGWREGLREGQGVMVWANGGRYAGQWANDKMNGIGSIKYCYGDVYSGRFVNGKPSGFGEKRFANGGVQTGRWENGKFVDTS